MKINPLYLACALALAAPHVHADEPALDTTIVTASRSTETVDQSLATVSVIDRADIERSQAHNLSELLRAQAGVDLARSGGQGGVTSLFLRGSNSNHVLVLVDGVRVSSFNTGALDWTNLPVSQIERIEIVRGPRAAYWGSDAIGGVVQIFTRSLDGGLLSGQFGSYGTRRGQAGWGLDGDGVRLSAIVSHERADGFSSQNDNGFGYHPDDDGLRQQAINLHAGFDIGQYHLDLRVMRADSDAEFDSVAPPSQDDPAESNARTQTISAELSGRVNENWQHQLVVARSRNDLDTPASASLFETRRTSIDWQNSLSIASGQHLLFGLNWLDEDGYADNGFGSVYAGERDNRAAYLGWRAGFGGFDTEWIGRYDDNSDYGGEFTGSAALGWRVNDVVRLGLSVGEGFRAPNLNELYSPGFGGFYAGNPDLEPERSRSTELAADFALNEASHLRLRAFRTQIRDMISFTGGGVSQAENIARARIDGIEAEYSWQWQGWLVNASATWQDPRDEATDAPLLRRAKRKASASVDRQLGNGISVGMESVLIGDREDAGFPSNHRLGGYGLFNLRAAWALTTDWSLELRAENVLDKDYTEVYGYNTPGRSAYAGFRWQPGRN